MYEDYDTGFEDAEEAYCDDLLEWENEQVFQDDMADRYADMEEAEAQAEADWEADMYASEWQH